MAEEWDDGPFDAPKSASTFEEGSNFGRGRGFSRTESKNDEWDDGGQTNGNGDDNYDSENRGDFDNQRRRGNGRGRGRGGRGGGRDGDRYGDRNGDRDGGRRRYNDDSNEDEGRENRRRDRNGDGSGENGVRLDENGEERKPPVTYIPEECDVEDLFNNQYTVGENFSNYDAIEVKVTGDNPLPPIQSFSEIKLRSLLAENIKKAGYTKPTPVQKHAIPNLLNSRDMMACAQTGSGKTAAFMIPIIQKLLDDPQERVLTERGCQPQVVVMSPTRELADQIYGEARKFAKDSIIKCAAIYGGVKTSHQGDRLRAGIDIVVATPGRLNDFVSHGRINFSSIRFIVLDEADRMLDQGFLPDMEKILNHETMAPTADRQTLMFSATFSPDVQKLCAKYLDDYLFLTVGVVGAANKDVDQMIYEVEKKEKKKMLVQILNEYKSQMAADSKDNIKILVFVETKKNADFIAAYLCELEFPTTSIHGDRQQMEREKALSDFRTGRIPILVATSVAARGLDINNVTHVINFDLPKAAEEYVHRIGRTGRVGNKGKASSFFDPGFDSPLKDELVQILGTSGQPIPDFLGCGSGEFGDAGTGNSFGGYDIRNNGGGYAEPQEEW